jgi:GTPase SAR1 family protein
MEYQNIKITMLGYTGTGKTCYMIGMYAFMKLGINGFTLSEQDLDRDLNLTEMWEFLIDKRTWPKGSTQNINYIFDFNYAFQPIMGFEWLDYRGAALSDSCSKEEVQKLIEQIKQSDCLFLCISAEDLQLTSKMKRARAIKADRMNVLISEIGKAVKPTANKPFPVSFVITKFDQYPKSNDPQQVIEAIKEIFPTFWTSPGWIVSVCPVSLGKELGENFEEGEIDPVNVHIPVSFAIYCKLYTQKIQEKIRLQELKNKTGQLNDQLVNLKSKNVFVRIWKGDEIDSTSSSIEKTAEELEKANQGLDETTKKLNLLSDEMMQTCFIYLNGEEGGFND